MRPIHLVWFPVFNACSPGDPSKSAEAVNEDPTIEIVSPMYGHTVTTEMEVDFLAEANDAETPSEELRVSWTSDIDGDLHAGSPDEDGDVAFESDTLSVGGHTITATVTDGDDGTAFTTTLLNVFEPGEVPVVAILSPNDNEKGVAGEPLELEAVVEDPDDMLQDLTIDFEVLSDDQSAECSDEPDEDGVAACTVTLAEGRVLIRVTATDPLGQTGTDELADFEVVPAEEHDGDGDDYTEVEGDCDDDNFTVHPEAPEIVDDIDNDCDGEIDEDTDTSDDDGDGMTELDGDCDDEDDSIFTGATEYLNGLDDDCDGTIDEGTIAFDDDGDCHCEGGEGVDSCSGSISSCEDLISIGDCDDADEDVYTGAPEVIDGFDNDCDGEIDEGTDSSDDDGDGMTEIGGDCDDEDDSIFLGATEYLNGLDDDCDGIIDEGTEAYDDDGDCYCEGTEDVTECTGSTSTSCEDGMMTGDCDDADEDIHPFAVEVCGFIDTDCDGDIGNLDEDFDSDGDGFSSCGDIDCDDLDPGVYPDAPEYCNMKDDDCNGVIDDTYAADTSAWFFDADGDGYGSETAVIEACFAPAGYLGTSGDCNDADPSINPAASEVCDEDNVDEDCDGSAEESDAIGKTWWYLDTDSDGYPASSDLLAAYMCDAYGSYVPAPADGMWDCDDTRSDINPGMAERCDWFDLDEDCDGEINEPGAEDGIIFYRDYDGDGFGDPFESEMLCEAGDITYYDATDNSDCCDWDPGANPSADSARTIPTTCGDYDWNCDGFETRSLTEMGDCGWELSLDSCSAEPEGWESSIPDCGEEEDWIRNCEVTYSWGIPSCDREVTTPETQPCL